MRIGLSTTTPRMRVGDYYSVVAQRKLAEQRDSKIASERFKKITNLKGGNDEVHNQPDAGTNQRSVETSERPAGDSPIIHSA